MSLWVWFREGRCLLLQGGGGRGAGGGGQGWENREHLWRVKQDKIVSDDFFCY